MITMDDAGRITFLRHGRLIVGPRITTQDRFAALIGAGVTQWEAAGLLAGLITRRKGATP